MAASAALLISAIPLTPSLFARSVKDAQTRSRRSPCLIVLPATLLQFADFLKTFSRPLRRAAHRQHAAILDTVKGA